MKPQKQFRGRSQVELDAKFYPHLLDIILEGAVNKYGAANCRLACRDWKQRVDVLLAKHVKLALRTISSCRLTDDDDNCQFTLSSQRRLPIQYASITSRENSMHKLIPPSLRSAIEILDLTILQRGLHLYQHQINELIPLNDLPRLHTIRMGPIWSPIARVFPHVRRIIFQKFQIGGHSWSRVRRTADPPAPACPSSPCRNLSRHTSKLVVGQNLHDPFSHVPPVPDGVREVVFVYLPAGQLRASRQLRGPRHHYLKAALPFARAAMKVGARVTIVRPYGETSPPNHEDNGETPESQFTTLLRGPHGWLYHHLGGDDESDNDEDPERLTQEQASNFRIITEEEYAMEVGQEAYELEMWWDVL